jgi:hypothetical protein
VGAVFLLAMPIHREGVFLELKSQGFGNFLLTALNGRIDKFLYVPTVKANEVVMVCTLIEFINRSAIPFAGLKMTAEQEACLLKLGEHPIYRSQPNVFIFFGHGHKDFFGTVMGAWMLMKKIQDLHPGGRGFKANIP